MCPMRILLVFFSATLAGYFAWRTFRDASKDEIDAWNLLDSPTSADRKSCDGDRCFDFKKVIERGFWGFVDMASGRYLWRNLKEMKEK